MQESFSIKPLNSFLKDIPSNYSYKYKDKENQIQPKQFYEKTSVVKPQADVNENILKEQHNFIINLSEQVRQLKLNNEKLNKENYDLEKNLEEEKNKNNFYEKSITKIIENNTDKNKISEIITNDNKNDKNVKNLESLIKKIEKKTTLEKDVFIQNKEKENKSIQVDLDNNTNFIPKLIVNIDNPNIIPTNPNFPSNQQENILSPLRINSQIQKKKEEITNILQKFININKKISLEPISILMNFYFYPNSRDLENLFVFNEINRYNMPENCWKSDNKKIKFSCFPYKISEFQLLNQISKSLKLAEDFFQTDDCKAFISLFREIPSDDPKLSIKELENANDFSTISQTKLRKNEKMVLNLKTKFCLFWLEKKLCNNFLFFKTYFDFEHKLYIVLQLNFSNEKLESIIFNNKIFNIVLNSISINLLKLDIYDNNKIPLSLKINLWKLESPISNNEPINKIIPNKIEENKSEFKLLKRRTTQTLEFQLKKEIDFQKEEISIEEEKKLIFLNIWHQIIKFFDFDEKYDQIKIKMSKEKKKIYGKNDKIIYEEFLKILSSIISEKIFLNHEKKEIDFTKIKDWDNFFLENEKFLDFEFFAQQLFRALFLLKDDGKRNRPDFPYHNYKNYWELTGELPYNIICKNIFFPNNNEIFRKCIIKPEINEQNVFNSLILYNDYEINDEDESINRIKTIISKWQMVRYSFEEINDKFDILEMKKNCIINEILPFHNFSFDTSEVDASKIFLFNVFTFKKLIIFYERIKGFFGVKSFFCLFLQEYFILFSMILIIPAIVNFILIIIFERNTNEYKITVLSYSMIILILITVFFKLFSYNFNHLKAFLGLLDAKFINNKYYINDIYEKNIINLHYSNIKSYGSIICYFFVKSFIILFYFAVFSFFLSIKIIITYFLSILKVNWTANISLADFNKYLDFNQFLIDLFDYIILRFILILFEKSIFLMKNTNYFSSETIFKEKILLSFKVLSTMNGFFQIIFVYPSLDNCVVNDCLTMCQHMYRNTLIIIFIFKFFKFLLTFYQYKTIESFKKQINDKTSDIMYLKQTMEFEKNNGKINKETGLNICKFTTKVLFIQKLKSFWFETPFFERFYDLISDFYIFLCYFVGLSALFSIDIIIIWSVILLEIYINRINLLFLTKGFFIDYGIEYYNLKSMFILNILFACILNVGICAFLFDSLFYENPIVIFFSILIFYSLFLLFIFYFLDDISQNTKTKLINNKKILNKIMEKMTK